MPRQTSKAIEKKPSWADLLSEAIRNDGYDHPGEGWVQFKDIKNDPQIKAAYPKGVGDCRLRALIRDGLKAGKVEQKECFLVGNQGARRSRHIFYRIK